METVDTTMNVVYEVVNSDGERYILMGYNEQIELLPTKEDIEATLHMIDTLK